MLLCHLCVLSHNTPTSLHCTVHSSPLFNIFCSLSLSFLFQLHNSYTWGMGLHALVVVCMSRHKSCLIFWLRRPVTKLFHPWHTPLKWNALKFSTLGDWWLFGFWGFSTVVGWTNTVLSLCVCLWSSQLVWRSTLLFVFDFSLQIFSLFSLLLCLFLSWEYLLQKR